MLSDILEPALPELFKNKCPVEPTRSFVVRDYKSSHYKEEKKLIDDLQVEWLEGLDSPVLPVLMEQKGRMMWDHDGVCGCGRRTYLFGQCLKCIENDRDDEERARAEAELEHEPVAAEEDVPPAEGPSVAANVGVSEYFESNTTFD